ncbi:9080_t:CDS:2 [Entrophospora sp. SA101]|nr:9080_t:CDS:2 [Entrophospora sp. SA101]
MCKCLVVVIHELVLEFDLLEPQVLDSLYHKVDLKILELVHILIPYQWAQRQTESLAYQSSTAKINYVIVVLVSHKPIVNDDDNIAKVEFIDPWDMIAPVYKIQFVDIYGDDQPKSLLSYCLKSLYLAEEIEAPDLMKLIGIWLNLNNKIVDEICDELNSSVLYQGVTCNLFT